MPGNGRRSRLSARASALHRTRPLFAGLGSPGRCTAPRSSTSATNRSARPFSGAISAPARNGRAIESDIGLAEVTARTANPPLEGFTAPKLLWVREHEPDAYARIRRVLLPKDFIRLRLTGEAAADVADASGTALFDVAKREWSDAMTRDLEIPLAWLPRVVESPEPAGALTAAAAATLGLPAGLPVAAGAGDQAAGGVAAGIVSEGDALVTIGSSGVVFVASDRPRIDPAGRVHTFCHALPETWHVMGVTQGAGISLRWIRDTLGARDAGDGDPYDALTREAAASPAGSRGLIWLPYLQGERTPHLDPNARGVLFGLTTAHGRGDVVRAVLEGVAFSLRDGLEIIRELGLPARRVKIAGGGARSPLWRQIVADVLGLPISLEPEDRGPAFGAALLAGVAVGVYASVEEACAQTASHTQPGRTARGHANRLRGDLPPLSRAVPGARPTVRRGCVAAGMTRPRSSAT